MNTQPKVSVIIPVYNAGPYLRPCLDSVLSQTLSDMEILCVDDGSTDDSPAILGEYAQRDPRLRILAQENRGAGAARNTGMAEARGKYLVFLDADDFFEPDLLEKQVEQCERFYADIGLCGANQFDVQNNQYQDLEGIVDFEKLGATSGVFSSADQPVYQIATQILWNKIFRTDFIREHAIRFQNTRRANDVFFTMAAMGTAKAIAFRDEVLAHYRVGMTTNLQSHNSETPKDFLHAFFAAKQYLEEAGVFGRVERSFRQSVVDGSIYNLKRIREQEDLFLDLENELAESVLPAMGILKNDPLFDRLCSFFVEEWATGCRKEEYGREYEALLFHWPASMIIPKIAKVFWNEGREVSERLNAVDAVRTTPRTVQRIGVYYHFMTIGGVENAIARLLPLWMSLGYECVLLTDQPPQANDYPVPEGVARVVLPSAFSAGPENYGQRAEALERAVREYDLDTIVYHAWVSECLLWDLLLLKACGAAVVLHCHGVFSFMLKLHYPQWSDFPPAYRLADAVVTLSEVDRYFWGQFNPRVFTVVNPVPPDLRDQPVSALEDPVIVWVGRLSDEKRPGDALRILRILRRTVPEARLMMVGDSGIDAAYLDRMKTLARELKVEDAVEFTGFRKDVSACYRSASVFLSTSDFEGFSLTLLEAGAAGLPCVMYRLDYLTLVRGNRGVFSVEHGDMDGAARKIAELLQDPQKRRSAGAAAREHALRITDFDYAGAWREIFGSLETERPDPPVPEDARLMWNTLLEHYRDGVDRKNSEFRRARQRLEQENDYYRRELTLVKQSFSFRLGQLLTWPARKARTFIRGWKENGFRYTMREYFLERKKT